MSASQQEAFLAAVAETSLGAPFLFEPDQYRTGSGLREPADLVWVCRRTVFLFNMTAGKKSAERQIEHNVKQLIGWLRIWATGRPLTGSNPWQSLSIELDDVDQIVILAIISNNEEETFAKFLWDITRRARNAAEEKLVAAVALPEAVLMDLARRGGSALDLSDYIAQLSTLPGVQDAGALLLLEEQNRSAVFRARAVTGAHSRPDQAINLAWRVVMAARQYPAKAVNVQKLLPGLEVFNDLDWEDTARIIVALADCTESVRNVPLGGHGPISATALLELGNYVFIVGAADLAKMSESSNPSVQLLAEHEEREPVMILNLIMGRPVVQGFTPMITIIPPTGLSAAFKVLSALNPAHENVGIEAQGLDPTQGRHL